jgi:hypothetical protein
VDPDPRLWLMDPDSDPDPSIFIIDLLNANKLKKCFFLYFAGTFEDNFKSFFKDRKTKKSQQ